MLAYIQKSALAVKFFKKSVTSAASFQWQITLEYDSVACMHCFFGKKMSV